ncbi:MAG TPA: hypothetical protein VFK02_28525 [Kofleriaceae bacterium]|nr:hypothetical protein [Kofleriaceae bacterium]
MRRAAWLLACGLVLGLGPVPGVPGAGVAGIREANAQPRRGEGRRDGPGGGLAERREQIKKKIRALRAYTLTEELALDEPTAGRLFPVLARYDDETDKLLERRVDLQRRLKRAESLRDGRAIDRLIDEAIANQHGFWELEDRRLAELRKILTPGQIARILVVLPALERRIQNQLRKAIVGRWTGPGGAKADDLDDDDPEPDEAPPPRRRRREGPLAPPSNAPGNTPPCDPNTQPCR